VAGKPSVAASARARILRMEGTPEARHNSLRPVAGWLRLTDGLELPRQSNLAQCLITVRARPIGKRLAVL
jgi:hypothetical protein